MSLLQSLGIDRLSVDDRIQLVQEIWDGIVAPSERIPLSDEMKQELDRRLAAHQADP